MIPACTVVCSPRIDIHLYYGVGNAIIDSNLELCTPDILIESRGLVFVMTGSSPRKLRCGGTNLLAGRAINHPLFPFTAAELGQDFSLEQALQYGRPPTIHDPAKHVEPEDYLAAYVQTYLREEVVAEGLTRQAGAFARFLKAASFSQGQPSNISAVARDQSEPGAGIRSVLLANGRRYGG